MVIINKLIKLITRTSSYYVQTLYNQPKRINDFKISSTLENYVNEST